LLSKEVAVEGDDITDAAPGLPAQSQQPIVNFRFNARGTRRFAHLTADNIGRPFAVVIDDQVVSAPVIREPIREAQADIGQLHARRRQQHRHAAALGNAARAPDRGRSAGGRTGRHCRKITGELSLRPTYPCKLKNLPVFITAA
jgi:preprotein translocase subunit SecD